MNVIKQSNEEVLMLYGGPQLRTKSRKYRLNKYCVKTEVKEGTLIYNAFTGALIMIRPFELINIYTEDDCDYVDFMVNNYFLVPENYDEDYMVEQARIKKSVPITETYLDRPHAFTILTTTKCNARCFYCYEMKSKNKHHMSLETAEKVAKYILKYSKPNTTIKLDWFGGEPTYNSQVIDLIVSRLASAGRDYVSSMISNGYLFDDALVEKAKNEWRLDNIQITLDGTEEVYNKIKNYIYKDCDSPYKKIIQNIHRLIDQKIHVSIRMNCDSHNVDIITNLINELATEFKDSSPYFSMYVWPIFEEGFVRTDEQREHLFDCLGTANQIIFDSGFAIAKQLDGPQLLHCQVDGGDGVTISPDGDLGLCEHYIDSEFWGHIDNPLIKNFDNIKEWRNYVPKTEICDDCALKPSCLRIFKCPDETPCSIQEKNYQLKTTILAMNWAWEQFKKNPPQQQCQNNCQNNTQNNSNKGPGPGEYAVYQRVFQEPDGTIRTEIVQ